MKISATTEIPRNKNNKKMKYANPVRALGRSDVPGIITFV